MKQDKGELELGGLREVGLRRNKNIIHNKAWNLRYGNKLRTPSKVSYP